MKILTGLSNEGNDWPGNVHDGLYCGRFAIPRRRVFCCRVECNEGAVEKMMSWSARDFLKFNSPVQLSTSSLDSSPLDSSHLNSSPRSIPRPNGHSLPQRQQRQRRQQRQQRQQRQRPPPPRTPCRPRLRPPTAFPLAHRWARRHRFRPGQRRGVCPFLICPFISSSPWHDRAASTIGLSCHLRRMVLRLPELASTRARARVVALTCPGDSKMCPRVFPRRFAIPVPLTV